MTKQTPKLKPPTHKQKNCNRRTASERSVEKLLVSVCVVGDGRGGTGDFNQFYSRET